MDARSQEVLRLIIQLHLTSGEPVGSSTVARNMRHSCSPATIRNIMVELEHMGCLDQPHTSAGRIPTDDGYRVYVDSLMGPEDLAVEEKSAIDSELRKCGRLPAALMENACHLLSRLSGNVGFAVAPSFDQTRMRHVEFVRLTRTRVMAILIAYSGIVTNRVFEFAEELTQADLQSCANYLNAHFSSMTLQEIRSHLVDLMRQERTLYDSLLRRVVALGREALSAEESDENRVYLDGASNILDQPELADVDRMRTILRAFEEKNRLIRILDACIEEEGLHVLIGHENDDPDLRRLSLVAAAYGLDDDTRWGLGVMGSTRMRYARVVALVGQVAQTVRGTLAQLNA
ncbi:MAG: heat-inducible transcription repressor HrcA [Vicinamibacteria bacterium]|nr:heat-inducible transcription repressor HrcA [Vicinamibacteria bacterium]